MSETIAFQAIFYFDTDGITKEEVDSLGTKFDNFCTWSSEYTTIHTTNSADADDTTQCEEITKKGYKLIVNSEYDSSVDIQDILQDFVDENPRIKNIEAFQKHESSFSDYPLNALEDIERGFISYRLAHYIGDSVSESFNVYSVTPLPWEKTPLEMRESSMSISRKDIIHPTTKEERKRVIVRSYARVVFDEYYH